MANAPGPRLPIPLLRVIVILLFTNLAVSALFAALTLLFSGNIIDFQLAAGSDQTRDELEVSLWVRAVFVLVVAVFYVWIARRMMRGRRGASMRVRSISAAGVVAVGYLLVTGAYPGWLRGVEIVQLVLLAVLVVLTNRKVVRDAFPRLQRPDRGQGNLRAALLLVVVTPVIAEVMLGTPAVRPQHRVYRAEPPVPRRVQHPHPDHPGRAPVSRPRNAALPPHPRTGRHRLRHTARGGTVATLRAAVGGSDLPHPTGCGDDHRRPDAALAVVALGVLPRRRLHRPSPTTPLPPAITGLACGAAALAFIALLYPFGGATRSAFTHGQWVLLPMAAAAVIALMSALWIMRWSSSPVWTDRHRLAALGGAVIAHAVFGAVVKAHTVPDQIVLAMLIVVTSALLTWYGSRLPAGSLSADANVLPATRRSS